MRSSIFWRPCAIALLSPTILGQVDQHALDKLKAQVVPVVAKATGTDLKDVVVRFTTRKELAKILADEAAEQSAATGSTKAQARVSARSTSKLLLAKFSWNTNEILLCQKNFEWQAKGMAMPQLNTPSTWRAVLVHECVHAADNKLYNWSKRVGEIKTATELGAFTAMIEGHAQFMAERICRDNGWSEGFTTYTSVIGKVSPDVGAGEKMLLEIAASNMAAAYIEGHRFFEKLEAELLKQGVARAFAAPPADFQSVLNLDWYLDPTLRPKNLYDLAGPLAEFGKLFDLDDWKLSETSITTPQLRAALSLLKKADVDRIVAHLKFSRMIIVQDKKRAGSRMVVAGLYEFDSPAEASFYVRSCNTLSKNKDAKLKTGNIQITKALYEQLEEPEFRGTFVEKSVSVGSQDVPVSTVSASHGVIAVELLYSNEEVPAATIKAQARKLLARSRKAAAPSDKNPEPGKAAPPPETRKPNTKWPDTKKKG